MLLRSCCTVWILLSGIAAAAVFVERKEANTVLQRWRRANSGFLEEMQQGNLERECLEETCSYEEAREVFEDVTLTEAFWRKYTHVDVCEANCQNNGTCVNNGTTDYCVCPEGFGGELCQTVVEELLKCLYRNGRCEHFCDGSGQHVKCSCADGYKLGLDGRQCVPKVDYPCGRLPPQETTNQSVVGQTRLVGANHCPKGECLWQVLIQRNGRSHCGGVLIRPDWVVTAAHCVTGGISEFTVVAGEHNLDVDERSEQKMGVVALKVHEHYDSETGDSDVALLKLNRPVTLNRHVVPVCLPSKEFAEKELLLVRYHTVSGWGKRTIGGNVERGAVHVVPVSPILRRFSIPILQNSQCSQKSQFNFTSNMLCAGYLGGTQQSCRGDDGSPLVTLYGSTHFLTGVVGWGRGCPKPGYYGVFANMANFVEWVEASTVEIDKLILSLDAAPEMLEQERFPYSALPPSLSLHTGHWPLDRPSCSLSRLRLHYVSQHSEVPPPSSPPPHLHHLHHHHHHQPPGVMSWLHRLSLGLLLLHLAAVHAVFLDGREASQVLTRRRRANSFWEEMKQGNMERECREERCDWEEAREIFENKERTNEFWAKYVDGDACESMPCVHNGVCKDGIGSYDCYCQVGYQGYNCEIVVPELCENRNGGCDHFCKVVQGRVECSCADGYFLASDDKSCNSNATFKCGAIVTGNTRTVFRYERNNTMVANDMDLNETDHNINSTDQDYAMDNSSATGKILPVNLVLEQIITAQMASMTRIVGGEDCPPGECPWQALLLNEEDRGFCGGTILNEYVILTAAHCMNQSRYIYIKLGEFDVLVDHGNEATHNVETIITHNNYKPKTYHNDIALIKLATPIKFSRYILPACIPEPDFAEKVLMRQPDGMVSGFGRIAEGRQPSTILQRLTVPYVDRATCIESTQLRISHRMFCAGYDETAKDACQGDSGGPHVTHYRGTYFITGIVSWGEGCARKGKYGIYTQVSKYIHWIREGIKKLMPKERSDRKKRHHGPINRLVL
ncbi:uncharacterized protein LOC115576963 [Sparus aurata]|nr:uncharacterized protein LOC115576963 [Sparus aurata]